MNFWIRLLQTQNLVQNFLNSIYFFLLILREIVSYRIGLDSLPKQRFLKTNIFVFFWGIIFFFLGFSALHAQVKIEFSPTGEVKKPSQVRARFSESMIPLGNPKFSLYPFEIRCPLQGAQRWVDDKNWVFEFTEPLPGGVECIFETKKLQSVEA